MKKKLFLRLCLILAVGFSVFSCRTDQFHENETYNNNSKFQLTSKRISLNEAKHKEKLVPELDKVETEMKTHSKTNVQGRIVNYGNGVSIDTDDVIYIEKGTDFHSYTFRINHENAPANAPVENLVISSQPDGAWKEVLVTYYLSSQEKQNLLSGLAVDFTGKVTQETLQNGTYSSAIMQQDVMNCYLEVSTYYTRCGGRDDHHNGELPVSQGGPCETNTPSTLVVSLVRKCTMALPVDTGLGENGEGGGSGPQNGPGGLGGNPPDETTTAPNVPLPFRKTPCAILNENSEDPEFQDKLDSLKIRVLPNTPNHDKHETAIVVTNDNGQLIYNTFITPNEAGPNVQSVSIETTNFDMAVMHNHTIKSAFLAPSYLDLVSFYDNYKYLDASMKKSYIYYLACYNGEVYALKANDIAALDAFFAEFSTIGSGNFSKDEEKKANDKMKDLYIVHGMEDKKPHNKDQSEKIFLKVAQSFGNGVSLYRQDFTMWGKLRLDPDGTVKKDDCP